MADKELRKMNRSELIEIIYALQQQEKAIREEKEAIEKKYQERLIILENAGSIAEASLSVSNVFEDAQDAANRYMESVKVNADAQLLLAQKQAEEIVNQAKQESEVLKKANLEQIQKDREWFLNSVKEFLKKNPELRKAFLNNGGNSGNG